MRDAMIPLEYLLKFIGEDAPFGDITSESIVPEVSCRALIRAEQEGIVAGLQEAWSPFFALWRRGKSCNQ